MVRYYIAKKIFTGENWLYDHALLVQDNSIEEIVPSSSIRPGIEKNDFGEKILAPAFIDLQLYGASGRLLAVYPDAETVQKIYEYSLNGGACYCVPTVATHPPEIFYKCIDAIKDYWKKGGPGVLGLHVEGPWINPIKKGAHVEEFIHPPSAAEVNKLLDYGEGVIKMITLAPEVCAKEIPDLIRKRGVIVSAGHSNATYEEAKQSFGYGVNCVTHLYNAMSALQHRSPGLAGATLDDEKIMSSIIPDGFHVDYAAIRISKKIMKERLFAITDSVTDTTQGYYRHTREGDKYVANGTLSGSALTMAKAFRNLVEHVGIDIEESLRMCSLYPARAANIDDRLGKIQPGYENKLIAIDEEMNIQTVSYMTK